MSLAHWQASREHSRELQRVRDSLRSAADGEEGGSRPSRSFTLQEEYHGTAASFQSLDSKPSSRLSLRRYVAHWLEWQRPLRDMPETFGLRA